MKTFREFLLETKLRKTRGTTKDTRGMEFDYIVYVDEDYGRVDGEFKKIKNKLFQSKDFPELSAKTLKDLKKKMGEKG